VKILGILGNDRGIDIATDRRLIEGLPDIAPPTFLVKPGRQDVTDWLWEQPMDILFFAGHSEMQQSTMCDARARSTAHRTSEGLMQISEFDRSSDWGLLSKVSKTKLKKALKNASISEH